MDGIDINDPRWTCQSDLKLERKGPREPEYLLIHDHDPDNTPSPDEPDRLTFGSFREHPYPYQHPVSVSVKTPTLTAANALQLHIDPTEPDTSPSSTHSHLDSEPISSTTRQNRVRFRSRVRITSGLHGHRHNKTGTGSSQNGNGNITTTTELSADSSLTSSPSSSISAPLRTHADDVSNKPGWGPLGRRVNLFVFQNRKRHHAGSVISEREREERRERRRRKLGLSPEPGSGFRVLNDPPDERTPLMAPKRSNTVAALERGDRESVEESELCESDDDEYEARLNREIDLIFGKWPGRLLNRYWWWWQLEPIVCCRCVDDSDLDDDE